MTALVVFVCDQRKSRGTVCGRFARRTVQHSVQQSFVISSLSLLGWALFMGRDLASISMCMRRVTYHSETLELVGYQTIIHYHASVPDTVTIVFNCSTCREKENVARNLSCVISRAQPACKHYLVLATLNLPSIAGHSCNSIGGGNEHDCFLITTRTPLPPCR